MSLTTGPRQVRTTRFGRGGAAWGAAWLFGVGLVTVAAETTAAATATSERTGVSA